VSLYADYLQEMGWGIVESPRGFATYKITGPSCYIQDVYVKPKHRKFECATNFGDIIADIARSAGCNELTCTVDATNPGWQGRREFLLKYGFKIITEKQEYLVFSKEI